MTQEEGRIFRAVRLALSQMPVQSPFLTDAECDLVADAILGQAGVAEIVGLIALVRAETKGA